MSDLVPKRGGAIAALAENYNEDPEQFEKLLVATVMPRGKNAPVVTKAHVAALCLVAHQFDLNPLTKQIYAFPDKQGGITPVISVDGWYAIANRQKEFDGIQFEEHNNDKGVLVATTCTIYRKDRQHPTVVTEHRSECERGTDPWRNQPRRMLRHRAAIQAIRIAFGISAMDPDEAERAERTPDYTVEGTTGSEPQNPIAAINQKVREAKPSVKVEVERTPKPEPDPNPEPEDDGPPDPEPEPQREQDVEPEPRKRVRRSRAVKAQREEFSSLMDRDVVDPASVSPHLPEEGETVEEAFASMWTDDAETLLERCRAGEFRGPQEAPEPEPDPEPQDDGPPDPEPDPDPQEEEPEGDLF